MNMLAFTFIFWSASANAGEAFHTQADISTAKAQFAACPLNRIQQYFQAMADQDEAALLQLMTPQLQERSQQPGSFRSAFFGKGKDFETQHGKITYLGHRFVKIDTRKEKPMYKFEVLMGFEKNGKTVARVEPIKFVFEGDLIDIAG